MDGIINEINETPETLLVKEQEIRCFFLFINKMDYYVDSRDELLWEEVDRALHTTDAASVSLQSLRSTAASAICLANW